MTSRRTWELILSGTRAIATCTVKLCLLCGTTDTWNAKRPGIWCHALGCRSPNEDSHISSPRRGRSRTDATTSGVLQASPALVAEFRIRLRPPGEYGFPRMSVAGNPVSENEPSRQLGE